MIILYALLAWVMVVAFVGGVVTFVGGAVVWKYKGTWAALGFVTLAIAAIWVFGL